RRWSAVSLRARPPRERRVRLPLTHHRLQRSLHRSVERRGELWELRESVRDQRGVLRRNLHLRLAERPLRLAVQPETLPVRRPPERPRQLRELRTPLRESRLLRRRVPVGPCGSHLTRRRPRVPCGRCTPASAAIPAGCWR